MLESTLHLYCCCYCVEARVVEAAGAQLARHNAESEQAVRYGEAWRNSVEAAHADLAEEIVAVKAEAACGARALRTALGVQARTTAAELKVMQGRFAVRSKGCPSCLVCGRGTERGPAEPLSPAVQSAGGAPWVGVALHARLSPLASRTASMATTAPTSWCFPARKAQACLGVIVSHMHPGQCLPGRSLWHHRRRVLWRGGEVQCVDEPDTATLVLALCLWSGIARNFLSIYLISYWINSLTPFRAPNSALETSARDVRPRPKLFCRRALIPARPHPTRPLPDRPRRPQSTFQRPVHRVNVGKAVEKKVRQQGLHKRAFFGPHPHSPSAGIPNYPGNQHRAHDSLDFMAHCRNHANQGTRGNRKGCLETGEGGVYCIKGLPRWCDRFLFTVPR